MRGWVRGAFRRPYVSLFAIALFWAAGPLRTEAYAGTIFVNAGQTIQSGINSASAGDTIMVSGSPRYESIVLDRSVTVRANGPVKLFPGSFRAIDVRTSNCGVVGFTFENFEQAISTNAPRSNVLFQNLTFKNVGAGIWVWGDHWTLEYVTINPFRCRSGEDYMNAFGSNHVFRRLFFAGLQMPQDIGPRPDGTYKHSDLIQTWTAGGMPGIQNSIIEECIFTDFAEGIYFHNETGASNAVNGNIVRNNVFWGTDIAAPPGVNLQPGPVHTTRFTGPSSNPGQIRNNLYFNAVACITADRVPGVQIEKNITMNSGGVYYFQNMSSSGISRTPTGNILWNNSYLGNLSQTPDRNINPQLQNPNSLLGPDGIPWTLDDGWRPMNPAVEGYGPQIALGIPVTDADQDLLDDNVETNNGTYQDPSNTGTDPNNPDTDGDGVMDGIEVSLGTDPNDENGFPILPLNAMATLFFTSILGCTAIKSRFPFRPSQKNRL